jgi:hypothetical protein
LATYDFIERFADLRQGAKKGTLSPAERGQLDEVKEKFAQAICKAQNILLQPGQRARSSFRVAVLFRVEITMNGAMEKTATLDVSIGGFAAPLVAPPATGTEGSFQLFLSKTDSFGGTVVAVGGTERKRVSFSFKKIDPVDAARLEDALFDSIIPHFIKPAK